MGRTGIRSWTINDGLVGSEVRWRLRDVLCGLQAQRVYVHKVDALIGGTVSQSIELIGYDAIQARNVTRSYDDQGTSDGFTARLEGRAWSIDGEKVRFRGAFDAGGSVLAGTWGQRSAKGRWSRWMDIELQKVT